MATEVAEAYIALRAQSRSLVQDINRAMNGPVRKSLFSFAGTMETALGTAISRVVTHGMMQLGRGLRRGFSGVIDATGDFEQALADSLAIMSVTEDQQARMAASARELSRETGRAATDMAQGYFFLASAGLDAEQSLASLPAVARFANAGAFDLALATDLLTDAQSALGENIGTNADRYRNMVRLSDELVKANVLANATVEQFSKALVNRSAAAFRQVGKESSELLAVLAALADQGLKGRRSGSLLTVVMRDLQSAALKNKTAFRQFGIQVFDSQGEMRNMADILEQFEKRFSGLSDEAKKSALAQLGITMTAGDVMGQMIGTSAAVRRYEQQLRSAGGTTDEVAKKRMATFVAESKRLGASIDDLRRTIGGPLLAAMKPMLTATRNSINAWNRWAQEILDANDVAGKFSTTAQKVSAQISSMVATVRAAVQQSIRPAIDAVIAAFAELKNQLAPIITPLREALGAIAPVIRRVAESLGLATAKGAAISVVVLAIRAAAKAALALLLPLGLLAAKVAVIGAVASPAFRAISRWIERNQELLASLSQRFSTFISEGIVALGQAAGPALAILRDALESVGKVATMALQGIAAWWDRNRDRVIGLATAVGGLLSEAFTAVNSIAGPVLGLLVGGLDDAGAAAGKLAGFLVEKLAAAVESVRAFVARNRDTWTEWGMLIKEIAVGVWTGVITRSGN